VMCSAERTIGPTLPTLQDLNSRRCGTRACRIMKDPLLGGRFRVDPGAQQEEEV